MIILVTINDWKGVSISVSAIIFPFVLRHFRGSELKSDNVLSGDFEIKSNKVFGKTFTKLNKDLTAYDFKPGICFGGSSIFPSEKFPLLK